FRLDPPDDLLRRMEFLPPELRRDRNATDGRRTLDLTTDRQLVMRALDAAREHEGGWPEWQLYWELNPIARWLDDRVLTAFGRHEAPVVAVPQGRDADERVVVLQGLASNCRGQPVLIETVGVRFRGAAAPTLEPFASLVARTGLDRELPNPGHRGDVPKELTALLAPAVERMSEHM